MMNFRRTTPGRSNVHPPTPHWNHPFSGTHSSPPITASYNQPHPHFKQPHYSLLYCLSAHPRSHHYPRRPHSSITINRNPLPPTKQTTLRPDTKPYSTVSHSCQNLDSTRLDSAHPISLLPAPLFLFLFFSLLSPLPYTTYLTLLYDTILYTTYELCTIYL